MYNLLFLGQCQASDNYAEQFRDTIKFSVPKGNMAAFFAEPIQVCNMSSIQSLIGGCDDPTLSLGHLGPGTLRYCSDCNPWDT